jgi:hypothetical protein
MDGERELARAEGLAHICNPQASKWRASLYVVDVQIRGIGAKANRVATVRTVWIVSTPTDPPRLVSAYPNP